MIQRSGISPIKARDGCSEFFGVKETDPEALTETDHLLGWLLRVLQQEDASDAGVLSEALQAALRYLDTLPAADSVQHKNAILYLYHLILFKRPETEREGLIQLIQSHTTDTEVRNIIMTGAEALIEQGARETTIENTVAILTARFPHVDVNTLKPALDGITDLDRLKALNLHASLVSSLPAFQHELEG